MIKMASYILFFSAAILALASGGVEGQEIYNCTGAQIDAQANQFFSKFNRSTGWTACGGKKWMTQFLELVPEGERHVVDIGCNKGYESGLFFDLLVPELGLTPEAMFKIHKQNSNSRLTGSMCGACNNCKETADRGSSKDSSKHTNVNVYCFEPSLVNFAALLNVEKQYRDALDARGAKWHLYNAAVSNYTGITSFPRECGSTLCTVHGSNANQPLDTAFVISVDDFVAQNKIDRLDVLKIDTEGSDPSVLFGASGVISQRRVDLLYFEYNNVGLWHTISLESIINWLAALDYVCYFEGTPTLTRLTGCWTPLYEFRRWSNIVCTHRGSYLYEPMESITFLSVGNNAQ